MTTKTTPVVASASFARERAREDRERKRAAGPE